MLESLLTLWESTGLFKLFDGDHPRKWSSRADASEIPLLVQHLCQNFVIPSSRLSFSLETSFFRRILHHHQCNLVQQRKVGRSILCLARAVLIERHVQMPVEIVLYPPVRTYAAKYPLGIKAGDCF